MSPEECRYLHISERSQNLQKSESVYDILDASSAEVGGPQKSFANRKSANCGVIILSVNGTFCRFAICGTPQSNGRT
jgi:hypothetical protein